METQLSILNHTAQNTHLKKYPLALKYQQQFLAQLIRLFEELYQNQTVDAFHYEIYELYTELLQSKSTIDVSTFAVEDFSANHSLAVRMTEVFNTDPTVGFVTHNTGPLVSILETNQIVSEGTTGFRTWPAALHLADYLINGHNDALDSTTGTFVKAAKYWKEVIELGAGSGLLGISLLKSNFFQDQKQHFYEFTDHSNSVLERIELNLFANGVLKQSETTQTKVSKLDWCDSTLETSKSKYDLILATDVVFDPALVDDLVKTLKRLMQLNKQEDNVHCRTDCLICCAERNTSLLDYFQKRLKHFGFLVETVSTRKHPAWVHNVNSSLKQLQNDFTENVSTPMSTLDADSVGTRIYSVKLNE